MAVIGGTLGRLPAAVFIVAGLIFGAWIMQSLGVQPNDIALWLNARLLWDMQLVVVLLPWLAVLAALTGLVFMVAHHHYAAMAAGGIVVAFLVIDFAWHLGLGTWITAHLTGAA